jgi:FKBP-type peptidyl-prolyl cis-trans isomerase
MLRFLVLLVLAVAAVAGSNEEGLKFLAGKEVEEGVITLASGLLYKDLTPGTTQ